MDRRDGLAFALASPLRAANAGLFVSRGRGRHPARRIDSHELIFVREGTLAMEEAGRAFEIRAGECLLLYPDRAHRGAAPYPPDLRFYWIHFAVTPAPAGSAQVHRLAQHTRLARPDRMTELFRRFLDDQETGHVPEAVADHVLTLMLLEAACFPAGPEGEGGEADLASRAEEYILTHAGEAITTADVAEALRCNPDHLGRRYRQTYGRTITEAIHRRRIAEARRRLLDGGETVAEIARRCGFEDPGYFRRVFKRVAGMSPRAYRRLYGRLHRNTE